MRASIRQVAELAQVSPMTVSRVMRGRKNIVNAETHERVIAAVRELNYIPVRSAMQNRHVETLAIGLVPYHAIVSRNKIDSWTYEGICEQARHHGYDLLIMLRDEAEWQAHRNEMRFLDRRCDGFIFISGGIGEWSHALESLVEHKIPTVVAYRRDVPEDVAWIDPDNQEIVHLALDCLQRRGHTRIAYLTGPDAGSSDENILAHSSEPLGSYDDRERLGFFQRLRSKMRSEPCVLRGVTPKWEVTPQVIADIRAQGITGVVCVNDLLALQVWALAEAAGLQVPGDLSLVGVDDSEQAAMRGLTSVAFGYDEVGRWAVNAWIERLGGKSAAECSQIVPVSLIERASVAPPKTQA